MAWKPPAFPGSGSPGGGGSPSGGGWTPPPFPVGSMFGGLYSRYNELPMTLADPTVRAGLQNQSGGVDTPDRGAFGQGAGDLGGRGNDPFDLGTARFTGMYGNPLGMKDYTSLLLGLPAMMNPIGAGSMFGGMGLDAGIDAVLGDTRYGDMAKGLASFVGGGSRGPTFDWLGALLDPSTYKNAWNAITGKGSQDGPVTVTMSKKPARQMSMDDFWKYYDDEGKKASDDAAARANWDKLIGDALIAQNWRTGMYGGTGGWGVGGGGYGGGQYDRYGSGDERLTMGGVNFLF